jgi:hypothetical protein
MKLTYLQKCRRSDRSSRVGPCFEMSEHSTPRPLGMQEDLPRGPAEDRKPIA